MLSKFKPGLGSVTVGVLGIIAYILVLSATIFFTWNWICPLVFGLPQVTLAQAAGLWLLSNLLIKPSMSKDSFFGNDDKDKDE